MSFVEKNWMLILVMFLSGAMLLWPILQRRFSPVKEVGNLNVTHLINHQNAVLLDVRETAELTGGKLPSALTIPLSQLNAAGRRARQADEPPGRRLLRAGQPQPNRWQHPRQAGIRQCLFPERRAEGVEGRGPAAGSGLTRDDQDRMDA